MNYFYEFKEYNIIVYNYNSLFHKALFLDYSDFLQKYNLKPKKFNRDIKNILTHLILSKLFSLLNSSNLSPILIFNSNFQFSDFYSIYPSDEFDSFIKTLLSKINSKFNIPVLELEPLIKFDLDTVYRFKSAIDNKTSLDFRKMKKFLADNNLKFLEKYVSDDLTFQLKLSK